MKIKVLDVDFEVTLGDGLVLETTLDGNRIYGSTREQLEEKLRRALRTKRATATVDVVVRPYNGWRSGGGSKHYKRITLRGKHATTSQYLVSNIDGTGKDAVYHPEILCLSSELTDEQLAALNAKVDAVKAAEAELAKLDKFHDTKRDAATLLAEANALADAAAANPVT